MRSAAVWAAMIPLVVGGSARAQPAGDPTPGTLAPLVTIVNPMDGAVVAERIRVQARVHHPLGASAVSSVTLEVGGEGGTTVTLGRNARYDLGPERAVYETVLTLAPGSHPLVATAGDGAGRSTRSTTVTVLAHEARGDGNLLVTDNSSQLCTACHSDTVHGSEAMGRAYGAWTTTCRDCHTPHDTVNASLIRESMRPPWFAGAEPPAARTVRFATRTGYSAEGGVANAFWATFTNGDASGPCQVCHTRTARWRSDGAADDTHRGNCTFCHHHRTGMKAVCDECHGIPPASGAHAAHAGPSAPQPPFPIDTRPLGCGNCHPAEQRRHGDGAKQVVLNADLTLPGGTRTPGATASGSGAGMTCLVACHFPLGAPRPSAPVAWSATGPLPCTSCHARIDPSGLPPTPRAGPSLHDPIFSEARPASGEPTTCYSCHDAAAHDATHLTGAPGLVASASVNATCIACHSPPPGPTGPQGQVLHGGTDAATSKTPPVFAGWSEATIDAASGDFHGGRRGTCFHSVDGPVACAPAATPTGYGGTLKPPYYRGYPAMPCATCHAGHASDNSFLFASVVNGTALPPGSIDRTGVGAERLCEACHEGGRHDRCVGCHTDAYFCDENAQCWMDGAANHVDPAPNGSACFLCHGHEGILRWKQPGPSMDFPWDDTCDHCHSGWAASPNPPTIVPPDFSAPSLSQGAPTVTALHATGATISWQTNEPSSTWLEYGAGMPGWVTGSATEAYAHTVTLTGLTPGTTYSWRIRSVDPYRNVLRTALRSFTTSAPGAVPFPDIVPVPYGWTGVTQPDTTMVVNLTWFPVSSPAGNPVQYRVQLASDAGFTYLENGSPPDSGWIAGTPTSWDGKAALYFGATLTNLPMDICAEEIPYNPYYWRVRARDAVTGVESEWSAVDFFKATSTDPWGC